MKNPTRTFHSATKNYRNCVNHKNRISVVSIKQTVKTYHTEIVTDKVSCTKGVMIIFLITEQSVKLLKKSISLTVGQM